MLLVILLTCLGPFTLYSIVSPRRDCHGLPSRLVVLVSSPAELVLVRLLLAVVSVILLLIPQPQLLGWCHLLSP